MSIKAQMARSTAGITGVTGERPSGSGKPTPPVGPAIPNKKGSKLKMVGSQGLAATRPDVGKHSSAPSGAGGTKVDQKWKGAPSSVKHVTAGPPPGP